MESFKKREKKRCFGDARIKRTIGRQIAGSRIRPTKRKHIGRKIGPSRKKIRSTEKKIRPNMKKIRCKGRNK